MLLLFFEQQQLFSDANRIRNYLIRNSLSVCSSLLGLNRKTSFSPVQRVYSCTEETAECSVQCVQLYREPTPGPSVTGSWGGNTDQWGVVSSTHCVTQGVNITVTLWWACESEYWSLSEDCDEARVVRAADIPGDMMGTVGVSWTPDTGSNTNKFYKNNNTRIYSPIKEAVHRDYSPLRETPREYFECLEDSECHDELFLLPEQVLDMDSFAVREDLSAIVPSFRSEDNAKYGFLSLRKYNEEYWPAIRFFYERKQFHACYSQLLYRDLFSSRISDLLGILSP